MYICVDFDGTIVDHRFPEIGPPAPFALDWLRRWHNLGGRLILFTIRADEDNRHGRPLADAIEYLERNGVTLYGANVNPDQHSFSKSPKAYGHVYVDDLAYGCPLVHPEGFVRPCVDWSIVGPDVAQRLQSHAARRQNRKLQEEG